MLEALEEELTAAAGAQRLIAIAPVRYLAAADVLVRAAKLFKGRPASARGDEYLTKAVTAEVAVELGTKGHV
jgi:hypothetical protein